MEHVVRRVEQQTAREFSGDAQAHGGLTSSDEKRVGKTPAKLGREALPVLREIRFAVPAAIESEVE